MKYGLRMTLPEGDPMRAAHLLGDNWQTTRWFETEEQRDQFADAMTGKFNYYRVGDKPSLEVESVQQ